MLRLVLSSAGAVPNGPLVEGIPIVGSIGSSLAQSLYGSARLPQAATTILTAEAGLAPDPLLDLRAEPLVNPGEQVEQGQPILRDRRRPHCVITAPMAGEVADLQLGAGRRLESLTIYGGEKIARHRYQTASANREVNAGGSADGLRTLLQAAGLWMRFRSRPFGHVPDAQAEPAAIFVMAIDTRPLAPDPRLLLDNSGKTRLELGLRALSILTHGPVHVCQDRGPDIVEPVGRVRIEKVKGVHPAGLAGFCIHRVTPARPDRRVWEVNLEDVIAIGCLLAEGMLPATRLVSLGGPGLREPRLVHCQPGADLRDLCYPDMLPGQKRILSGSVLDGRESRWLGMRDRQVTVLDEVEPSARRHWLRAALARASRPEPIIPTAALEQAMGDYAPALPLLRALSVGDDETVMDLGGLSLLEEDLALADYATAASPSHSLLLRAALNRIEENL